MTWIAVSARQSRLRAAITQNPASTFPACMPAASLKTS